MQMNLPDNELMQLDYKNVKIVEKFYHLFYDFSANSSLLSILFPLYCLSTWSIVPNCLQDFLLHFLFCPEDDEVLPLGTKS